MTWALLFLLDLLLCFFLDRKLKLRTGSHWSDYVLVCVGLQFFLVSVPFVATGVKKIWQVWAWLVLGSLSITTILQMGQTPMPVAFIPMWLGFFGVLYFITLLFFLCRRAVQELAYRNSGITNDPLLKALVTGLLIGDLGGYFLGDKD